MINMKKKFKKILTGIMLSAIVLVVGGFCSAPMAGASSSEMNGMVEVSDVHCGSADHLAKNKAPISDAMMPCCVEKHDNSSVFTPVVLNEKIKFEQVSIAEQPVLLAQTINQKTYASSSSPPEPDLLFSSVRLE
jgi:hypothetical protein